MQEKVEVLKDKLLIMGAQGGSKGRNMQTLSQAPSSSLLAKNNKSQSSTIEQSENQKDMTILNDKKLTQQRQINLLLEDKTKIHNMLIQEKEKTEGLQQRIYRLELEKDSATPTLQKNDRGSQKELMENIDSQ